MTQITGRLQRDNNHVPLLGALSSVDSQTPVMVQADPATGRLLVQTTGTVNSGNMLVTVPFDSIYYTNTSTTVDTYVYKSSGSTVATVTITYTDTTKSQVSSVVRS